MPKPCCQSGRTRQSVEPPARWLSGARQLGAPRQRGAAVLRQRGGLHSMMTRSPCPTWRGMIRTMISAGVSESSVHSGLLLALSG